MGVKNGGQKQWTEENGGKYVRQPRFFKNCRAAEKKKNKAFENVGSSIPGNDSNKSK
jgi:hypothetical protein